MFWENILRVSIPCKVVLDCLWIESRIENASNGGFCLGVVTTMGEAVHRPGLSGARLDKAKSNSFEVVTGHGGVHRYVRDGAPSMAVRCHHRFLTEAGTC